MLADAELPVAAARPARGMLPRIALMLGATVVGLVLAEVALRALGITPPRWTAHRHVESADKTLALDLYGDDPRDAFPLDLRDDALRDELSSAGLSGLDEYSRHTPHGVALHFTSELCRQSAPIAPRDPSRPRVVILGDSFTEGQGVRDEATFAARLGAALPEVEVINCGRRGYDFPALRELFDRHLALDPDVVVYAMLMNDPERSEEFAAGQSYLDDWIVDRRRAEAGAPRTPGAFDSWALALITDRLEGLRVGAETTRWYHEIVAEPNAAGWQATLDHIEAMRDAMHARHDELVVALLPLLIGTDGAEHPFAHEHDVIAEAMAARGVPFFDLTSSVMGTPAASLWVHPADRHPNGEAHARFAESLRVFVEEAAERARARHAGMEAAPPTPSAPVEVAHPGWAAGEATR